MAGDVTVTMGVDQVAAGLEIAVVSWSPDGARESLFAGVIGRGRWQDVLVLGEVYQVTRALIDPSPDTAAARSVIGTKPEVYAAQEGAQHNAASLAETAYRRYITSRLGPPGGIQEGRADVAHVLSVDADPTNTGAVIVRTFIPAGHEAVTHLVIDLGEGDVMWRDDGSSVVEAVVPHAKLRFAKARVPLTATPLMIAPTTTLPAQGWTAVLSIYAGTELIRENEDTENQLMGLANVVGELARETADWISRNAVEIEAEHPAVNLGFEQFATDAQVTGDTFDVER